jgi:hypothetical protein
MNLAGFILGIEYKNYTILATDHPTQNSGRDCQPAVEGLRFAVLFPSRNGARPPSLPAGYSWRFTKKLLTAS